MNIRILVRNEPVFMTTTLKPKERDQISALLEFAEESWKEAAAKFPILGENPLEWTEIACALARGGEIDWAKSLLPRILTEKDKEKVGIAIQDFERFPKGAATNDWWVAKGSELLESDVESNEDPYAPDKAVADALRFAQYFHAQGDAERATKFFLFADRHDRPEHYNDWLRLNRIRILYACGRREAGFDLMIRSVPFHFGHSRGYVIKNLCDEWMRIGELGAYLAFRGATQSDWERRSVTFFGVASAVEFGEVDFAVRLLGMEWEHAEDAVKVFCQWLIEQNQAGVIKSKLLDETKLLHIAGDDLHIAWASYAAVMYHEDQDFLKAKADEHFEGLDSIMNEALRPGSVKACAQLYAWIDARQELERLLDREDAKHVHWRDVLEPAIVHENEAVLEKSKAWAQTEGEDSEMLLMLEAEHWRMHHGKPNQFPEVVVALIERFENNSTILPLALAFTLNRFIKNVLKNPDLEARLIKLGQRAELPSILDSENGNLARKFAKEGDLEKAIEYLGRVQDFANQFHAIPNLIESFLRKRKGIVAGDEERLLGEVDFW
ncbi:MAG: hypothetical protein AAF570_07150 [Bacteroidota bacterium]